MRTTPTRPSSDPTPPRRRGGHAGDPRGHRAGMTQSPVQEDPDDRDDQDAEPPTPDPTQQPDQVGEEDA